MKITTLGLWLTAAAITLAPFSSMATHTLYESNNDAFYVTDDDFEESWTTVHTPWPGALPNEDGTQVGDVDTSEDYARKWLVNTEYSGSAVPLVLRASATEPNTIIRIDAYPSEGSSHDHPDQYSECPDETVTRATSNPPAGFFATTGETLDRNVITVQGLQSASLRLGSGQWIIYIDGVLSPASSTITATISKEDPVDLSEYSVATFRERLTPLGFPVDGIPFGMDLGKCGLSIADSAASPELGVGLASLLDTALPAN